MYAATGHEKAGGGTGVCPPVSTLRPLVLEHYGVTTKRQNSSAAPVGNVKIT